VTPAKARQRPASRAPAVVRSQQTARRGNEESHTPSISSDGRYVAFSSPHKRNRKRTRRAAKSICGKRAQAPETHAASMQLISLDSHGALVGTQSISFREFFRKIRRLPGHHPQPFLQSGKKLAELRQTAGYRQVFIRDTCLGAPNCTPRQLAFPLQPGVGIGSQEKSPPDPR